MCLSGKCVTLWCRKTMTIMTGGKIWLLATTVKNAKTAKVCRTVVIMPGGGKKEIGFSVNMESARTNVPRRYFFAVF